MLCTKYYDVYQVEDTEMGRGCTTHGRVEKCIQNCGRESEGKRSLGRPRRRLEVDIKMDLI
jgi:hypothetical protein